jgi:hypothetical protein
MRHPIVKVEQLSADEERMVAKSRVAHIWLLALAITVGIALLLGMVLGADSNSLGELMFAGSVFLLVAAGILFLAYLLVGVWRDYRSKTKLVVRGKVSAVNRSTSASGLHYSIRVGEEFVASDPLYSPVPGYLASVRVGDVVEISYLIGSRRTLSVIPA